MVVAIFLIVVLWSAACFCMGAAYERLQTLKGNRQ